jgi:hypothetical protein
MLRVDMSSYLITRLSSVPDHEGMSCAQLALCAATGKSRKEVDAAILRSANLLGLPLDWNSINTAIWRRALEELEFVAMLEYFDPMDSMPRMNVDQFMAGNDRKDVILVVSVVPEDHKKDHVFAAKDKCVVDFYTEGRIKTYRTGSNSLGRSRVDHFVRVRRH